MHQNIYVLRTSKLKTRPGRFDSSEIGWRIVFHAGRSLLGVQLPTLRERSRKVGRKKRQRYSNEFRRNAVERMNACDNIIALAQGGSAFVADCSTFGVIHPPRPLGSSLVTFFGT
jgi:hypothetical protein